MSETGTLAAALAKAQGEFPPITRDRTVTVQTKAGGSYTFSYAPLDTVLAAVRAPLAKHGLAIIQLLDHGELATMLLHESGEVIEGRTPLPATADVQAFGSAVTYMRRYTIQALLGLATEEDDDGNRAAGNGVKPGAARAPRPAAPQQPATATQAVADGSHGWSAGDVHAEGHKPLRARDNGHLFCPTKLPNGTWCNFAAADAPRQPVAPEIVAALGDAVEPGPAAGDTCGDPSPYDQGMTRCNLLRGHGRPSHRNLDADGKPTASWPVA